MFLMFLCQKWTCLCQHTRKEQSTCPLVFLLTCQLTTLCQLFRMKFNIMSVLFTNQSPTLPQKIDSREGLF